MLTGSLHPTPSSGYTSSRGSGLARLFKHRGTSAASKKNCDYSISEGDNRRLVARPNMEQRLPSTDAPSSQTTITGPALSGSGSWGLRSNVTHDPQEGWFSGTQSGDRLAARSCNDIELQAADKPRGGGLIVVRNDFNVHWAANGQQMRQ